MGSFKRLLSSYCQETFTMKIAFALLILTVLVNNSFSSPRGRRRCPEVWIRLGRGRASGCTYTVPDISNLGDLPSGSEIRLIGRPTRRPRLPRQGRSAEAE